MAKFEYSREEKVRKPKSRSSAKSFLEHSNNRRNSSRSPKRGSGRSFSRGSGRSGDFRGSKDSGRSSGRSFGRDRKSVEMTKVICSSCGEPCEVPFRPTSTKPVYCSECYSKTGAERSGPRSSGSGSDIKEINKKLDKIMKALKID